MEDIRLINEDCLEALKDLPNNSVDLVCTDPPYNIKKAKWDKWKTTEEYINWCGLWIKECERVLKDNGSFYFFHNDIQQIAMIMEWMRENTKFVFNSFIIWDKENFRAISWKNPSEKNNLRSWFNTCEYCLFYTFQDETGLSNVMLDVNNFPTMRKYFRDLSEFISLTKTEIIQSIGQCADHCFRYNSSQWNLPTPETYEELIRVFKINEWDGFREYEDLRKEYEDLRFIHNLDKNHNNVWRSNERNSGKLHPTKKPVDILERIINTSSNPGYVVLDPFMGSGSTGVACVNTGRKFIGIELNKNYFDISEQRIKDAAFLIQKTS